MKQQLLKTKSINVEGILVATEVYVTKKVAKLKENKEKGINIGWNAIGVDCSPKCRTNLPDGYEMCIGGTCVFFPNP